MSIHPTAIISPSTEIGNNVTIGAYSVIGEHVKLHDNVIIHNHVNLDGRTEISEGTQIYPFASIGTVPQDLKYKGEPTTLVIGKNNTIREHVTMNIGTEGGGGMTRIGDHNLFMVGVHVGHDCQIGSHCIFANNATLAGHVEVGDGAVLGGLSAVHQFCRIGDLAMVGGMTGVERDVIPFGMATGNRASLKALNLIGLDRKPGIEKADLNGLRAAFKRFSADGLSMEQRVASLKDYPDNPLVAAILAFIETPSKRGLVLFDA